MTTSLLPGPRVLRVTLVLGALCGLTEALTSPLRDGSTYSELGHIADHQDSFAVSTMFGLAATVLGLVNFLGLSSYCRPTSPRLAVFTGWLLAFSMMSFMGVRMIGAVELQSVRDGLPRSQGAGLVDHLAGVPVAVTMFALFLGGAVVGLISLGMLVWRAGLPKPAALAFIAFNVIDLSTGYRGEIVAHAVLLIGSGSIAWAIGRRESSDAVAADPDAPIIAVP